MRELFALRRDRNSSPHLDALKSMQSARTKQLIILGNRKNRTNDLLREVSARRSREPQLCPRSQTTFDAGCNRWSRARKRLKAVQPKVDTGLRRRRIRSEVNSDQQEPQSLELDETLSTKGASSSASSDRIIFKDVSIEINDDFCDEELPPRTRVRRICARDARKALIVLRERPMSPTYVEKFCVALDAIRAQRAFITAELLLRTKDIAPLEEKTELEVDSDQDDDFISDYDPAEQISEEFRSVFGAVAHESRDLLKREETSIKQVQRHLLAHYPAIRNIFKYYSSMTKPFDENITAAELGSMTLADWMTFVKDCELVGSNPKRQLVKSSAELLFIRLNWVTDDRGRKVKNQDASNSDRTLIMPEFMCGILRLAKQLGERQENFGLTASHFISKIICKRAHAVDVEEFRTRVRYRSVQRILDEFSGDIQSLFVKYAAAEAKSAVGAGLETMDLKELMQMCRYLKIVSVAEGERHMLTPLAVQHAFALSQLQVVGEDAGEIDAGEFVELIARLAENFFDVYFAAIVAAEESDRNDRLSVVAAATRSTAPAPSARVHLACKLEWFLPRLRARARRGSD